MNKVARGHCLAAKNHCYVARYLLVVAIGCLSVMVWFMPRAALAAETAVSAGAALLMDAETGAVLWEKDGYRELPPASTTKILTALLALDISPMEREVTVSAQAAAVGESGVGLIAGERFRLGELLDAAMLKSANDACFAIAEGAVGSEPFFVRLMNLKADALGAAGANLCNTNGLPADEHCMSCYDLAVLARYAMRNHEFAGRVGSRYGKMEGGSYTRDLKNTNKLLAMNEYVTGIKTGTTNAAGACLVSSMERNGRSVIAVVLNSADRYGDSLKLLNMGIDDFCNRVLIRRGEVLGSFNIPRTGVQLPAVAAADLCVTLAEETAADSFKADYAWRRADELTAVAKGDLLGTLRVYSDGKPVGAVNLLAAAEYRPSAVTLRLRAAGEALRSLLRVAFGG